MEYCSYISSSAPKYTLDLLNSIQRRAVRLIDDPELTNLESLEHRRKNLQLTDEPVICNLCDTKLKRLAAFKENIITNEFQIQCNQKDLNSFLETVSKDLDKVCRVCLKSPEDETKLQITNWKEYRKVLNKCNIHLNLNIPEPSKICNDCDATLQDMWNFVDECSENENNILLHSTNKGKLSTKDLLEIASLKAKNVDAKKSGEDNNNVLQDRAESSNKDVEDELNLESNLEISQIFDTTAEIVEAEVKQSSEYVNENENTTNKISNVTTPKEVNQNLSTESKNSNKSPGILTSSLDAGQKGEESLTAETSQKSDENAEEDGSEVKQTSENIRREENNTNEISNESISDEVNQDLNTESKNSKESPLTSTSTSDAEQRDEETVNAETSQKSDENAEEDKSEIKQENENVDRKGNNINEISNETTPKEVNQNLSTESKNSNKSPGILTSSLDAGQKGEEPLTAETSQKSDENAEEDGSEVKQTSENIKREENNTNKISNETISDGVNQDLNTESKNSKKSSETSTSSFDAEQRDEETMNAETSQKSNANAEEDESEDINRNENDTNKISNDATPKDFNKDMNTESKNSRKSSPTSSLDAEQREETPNAERSQISDENSEKDETEIKQSSDDINRTENDSSKISNEVILKGVNQDLNTESKIWKSETPTSSLDAVQREEEILIDQTSQKSDGNTKKDELGVKQGSEDVNRNESDTNKISNETTSKEVISSGTPVSSFNAGQREEETLKAETEMSQKSNKNAEKDEMEFKQRSEDLNRNEDDTNQITTETTPKDVNEDLNAENEDSKNSSGTPMSGLDVEQREKEILINEVFDASGEKIEVEVNQSCEDINENDNNTNKISEDLTPIIADQNLNSGSKNANKSLEITTRSLDAEQGEPLFITIPQKSDKTVMLEVKQSSEDVNENKNNEHIIPTKVSQNVNIGSKNFNKLTETPTRILDAEPVEESLFITRTPNTYSRSKPKKTASTRVKPKLNIVSNICIKNQDKPSTSKGTRNETIIDQMQREMLQFSGNVSIDTSPVTNLADITLEMDSNGIINTDNTASEKSNVTLELIELLQGTEEPLTKNVDENTSRQYKDTEELLKVLEDDDDESIIVSVVIEQIDKESKSVESHKLNIVTSEIADKRISKINDTTSYASDNIAYIPSSQTEVKAAIDTETPCSSGKDGPTKDSKDAVAQIQESRVVMKRQNKRLNLEVPDKGVPKKRAKKSAKTNDNDPASSTKGALQTATGSQVKDNVVVKKRGTSKESCYAKDQLPKTHKNQDIKMVQSEKDVKGIQNAVLENTTNQLVSETRNVEKHSDTEEVQNRVLKGTVDKKVVKTVTFVNVVPKTENASVQEGISKLTTKGSPSLKQTKDKKDLKDTKPKHPDVNAEKTNNNKLKTIETGQKRHNLRQKTIVMSFREMLNMKPLKKKEQKDNEKASSEVNNITDEVQVEETTSRKKKITEEKKLDKGATTSKEKDISPKQVKKLNKKGVKIVSIPNNQIEVNATIDAETPCSTEISKESKNSVAVSRKQESNIAVKRQNKRLNLEVPGKSVPKKRTKKSAESNDKEIASSAAEEVVVAVGAHHAAADSQVQDDVVAKKCGTRLNLNLDSQEKMGLKKSTKKSPEDSATESAAIGTEKIEKTQESDSLSTKIQVQEVQDDAVKKRGTRLNLNLDSQKKRVPKKSTKKSPGDSATESAAIGTEKIEKTQESDSLSTKIQVQEVQDDAGKKRGTRLNLNMDSQEKRVPKKSTKKSPGDSAIESAASGTKKVEKTPEGSAIESAAIGTEKVEKTPEPDSLSTKIQVQEVQDDAAKKRGTRLNLNLDSQAKRVPKKSTQKPPGDSVIESVASGAEKVEKTLEPASIATIQVPEVNVVAKRRGRKPNLENQVKNVPKKTAEKSSEINEKESTAVNMKEVEKPPGPSSAAVKEVASTDAQNTSAVLQEQEFVVKKGKKRLNLERQEKNVSKKPFKKSPETIEGVTSNVQKVERETSSASMKVDASASAVTGSQGQVNVAAKKRGKRTNLEGQEIAPKNRKRKTSQKEMPGDSDKPNVNNENSGVGISPRTTRSGKERKNSPEANQTDKNENTQTNGDALPQNYKESEVSEACDSDDSDAGPSQNKPVVVTIIRSKKTRNKAQIDKTWQELTGNEVGLQEGNKPKKRRGRPPLPAEAKKKQKPKPVYFLCDSCPFKTISQNMMVQHQFIHNVVDDVAGFKCNECAFRTTNREALEHHKTIHLQLDVTYKCVFCEYLHRKKQSTMYHTLRHDDKDVANMFYCIVSNHLTEEECYECFQCEYQNTEESTMPDHVIDHQTETIKNPITTKFSCKECLYKTKFEDLFQRHQEKHKEMKKYLNQSKKLKKEIKREEEEEEEPIPEEDPNDVVYACDQCSYLTHQKRSLSNHKGLKHNRQEASSADPEAARKKKIPLSGEIFYCNECAYVTNKKPHLSRHMLVHRSKKNMEFMECQHCLFETKHRRSFTRHMEMIHRVFV